MAERKASGKGHAKSRVAQRFLNLFFILLCLCYILPLMLLISVSFEGSRGQEFSLIPKQFSIGAYAMILQNPVRLFRAYGVTAFYSIVGVLGSLVVMSLFAYALSRRHFKLRGVLSFLLFFTTLFSGGMVPSYIINSRYLHLNDTIWIYILPGLVNAFNVIVIRTYFQNLPVELFECAHLDGASELQICFRIAIPLSTPALASVGFLRFVDAWNNWSTSQVYIRNTKLFSLQYLLKLILDDIQYMEQLVEEGRASAAMIQELANAESMRFAMTVMATVPALLVFPFFQKYFAKGLTLGAVKG